MPRFLNKSFVKELAKKQKKRIEITAINKISKIIEKKKKATNVASMVMHILADINNENINNYINLSCNNVDNNSNKIFKGVILK